MAKIAIPNAINYDQQGCNEFIAHQLQRYHNSKLSEKGRLVGFQTFLNPRNEQVQLDANYGVAWSKYPSQFAAQFAPKVLYKPPPRVYGIEDPNTHVQNLPFNRNASVINRDALRARAVHPETQKMGNR